MQLITYRNRCQEQWNWEVWRLDKAVRGARSCGSGCQKALATPSPSHVLGGPGDPVLPARHLSTPERENARRGGTGVGRGELSVPISHHRAGWGGGDWFLVVAAGHLQGTPRIPSARLRSATGAARALLSISRAARSPSGASRPPCLAQATARSPSLPDAALAPAGIQQPSPAGAPRCLPITHERCRAVSSRDGERAPGDTDGAEAPARLRLLPSETPKATPQVTPARGSPRASAALQL